MFTSTLVCIILLTMQPSSFAQAQNNDGITDVGRIVLGIYLPDRSNIPEEARSQLQNKLARAAVGQGMSGNPTVQRFMLTAKADVLSKDVIAGPPQLIAISLEISVFVGDATDNTLFSSVSFPVKGVGINENKAFIDALKKVNANDPQLARCLEESKGKIINYYSAQCDAVIKMATSVASLGDHDQAIHMLAQVPDVCSACYARSLEQMELVYQAKIAVECKDLMANARAAWKTKPNADGAQQVATIAGTIPAFAPCTKDMEALLDVIEPKLRAEQEAERQQRAREEADRVQLERERLRQAGDRANREAALESQRIAVYGQVATAYARRLPRYTRDVVFTWY